MPKLQEEVSTIDKLKEKIKIFLDEIYLGEETYNKIYTKLINAVKVFIVASRKFMKDDCMTKASSIAYTTIISLIPTLTVALTFFSFFYGVGDKKDELFRRITLFMIEHNIKLNIDPFLQTISSLIENAGKIGGVGAVVLVFSATAVLRTLEKSLNDIWKVKRSRSIYMKIIFYWAALTLGPLMFIAGTTVATQISTAFSPPHYYAMSHTGNDHWVVGNKAAIMYNDEDNLEFEKLKPDVVDFDNQRIFSYDPDEKEFKAEEYQIEEFEYKRSTFRDIQFAGKRGWIVGKSGIILTTIDGGKTWSLEKWGTFNFNDIHMLNSREGFIAADHGYMLRTSNGGKSWELMEWDIRAGFNAIAFQGSSGIIAGDDGYLLRTGNNGKEWKLEQVEEARRKGRSVNLNDLFFVNENTVWVAANEGLVLHSSNGGISWNAKKFREDNYYTVFFEDSKNGFIAGDDGNMLYTKNGGNNWHRKNLPGSQINRIGASNGNLWCTGDKGMLMQSTDTGQTWTGIEGTSFVIVLLNFFAPFIFIWGLFMLMYIVLPNTKVPIRPSAIGAAFTGGVWVVFILLFIVYIKAFARGTFAIYGSLAAFPLFLIMVYASAVIILYGAEVSYTLMNPLSYRNLKRAFKDRRDLHIYSALAILTHIHAKFQKGKGPSTFKELLPVTMQDYEELEYFLELFIKEKLLLQTEDDRYIPADIATNTSLLKVVDMVYDVTLTIPGSKTDRLRKYLRDIFHDMQRSRKDMLKGLTLQNLVNEVNR